MEHIDSKGDFVDFLFTRYLSSKTRNRVYLELFVLLRKDFFTFMTVFSGRSIRFPSIAMLQKLQRDVDIHHDACTMPIEEVCEKYGMRKNAVTVVKNKIERQFAKFDILKEAIDDGRFKESYTTYKGNTARRKSGACANGKGRASSEAGSRGKHGEAKLAPVENSAKQNTATRTYVDLLDFIREKSV